MTLGLGACHKRDYRKALQQIANALFALSGTGSQRARLTKALSICVIRISPDGKLPAPLEDRFTTFLSKFSPNSLVDDAQKVSEVVAAVAGLNDEDVCEAIKFIIIIFAELAFCAH